MKKIIFRKINTARDWRIIILAFALGFVIISFLAWQIYLSSQIGGGYFSVSDSSNSPTVKIIDKKKLQADLLLLQKETAGVLKVVDPSL